MLLFVQFVQISRAMTTYENMRGSHHMHGSRASEALTSALTAGTASMARAQLGPGLDIGHDEGHHHHHHHKEGCFAQWKKILGVDTFVETALPGNSSRPRRNRNPFTRGCLNNCKDFWCDPAPIFGKRENGLAMLGGEVINYTSMYETPLGVGTRTRRGRDTGGSYQSVAADDSV